MLRRLAPGGEGTAGFNIVLEVLAKTRDLVQGVVLVRRDEPARMWDRFMANVRALASGAVASRTDGAPKNEDVTRPINLLSASNQPPSMQPR